MHLEFEGSKILIFSFPFFFLTEYVVLCVFFFFAIFVIAIAIFLLNEIMLQGVYRDGIRNWKIIYGQFCKLNEILSAEQ